MSRLVVLLLMLLPVSLAAEERLVRLHAPEALVETGLMKHILPRFTLKTQVRVTLVPEPEAADMVLGDEGRPVFRGQGTTWRMALRAETPHSRRFADWLTSDIGRRTIYGYAPDGAELFGPVQVQEVAAPVAEVSGDAVLGRDVARLKCARCHAVDDATRMTAIGSTPSFFVLRSFGDWETRFTLFYRLAPHGAFTQVAEITAPFPEDRPSPIVPIEMTLEEVEAVTAYVAGLPVADLGKPLEAK